MFKNFKFILASVVVMTVMCVVNFESFCDVQQSSEPTTEVAEITSNTHSIGQGLGYMAAALAIAVGSLGAGYAVAASVPAALGAFSENPNAFGKILIFVALGEGISIFSFVISMIIISGLK